LHALYLYRTDVAQDRSRPVARPRPAITPATADRTLPPPKKVAKLGASNPAGSHPAATAPADEHDQDWSSF
jgi:hypothetical protein